LGYLFPMIATPDPVRWRPIHENGGTVVVFLHQAVFGSADFNACLRRHCLLIKEFPFVRRIELSLSSCAKATEKPQLDVSHAVSNLVSTSSPRSCPCLRMRCVACGYYVLSLALVLRLRLPKGSALSEQSCVYLSGSNDSSCGQSQARHIVPFPQ
jgi:hypothetical protein